MINSNAQKIQVFDWRLYQIEQKVKEHERLIQQHESRIKELKAQREAVFSERIKALGA